MLRPALRHDVTARAAGEAVELGDTLLGRTFTMRPPGRALVERLDGRRTSAELVAELVAAGTPAENAESLLRQLLLLNLLVGGGETIRGQIAALVGGAAALDYVTLEGARFACQGSGQCCQNYIFGPLRDADLERIDAHDVQADFPQLGGGPWWEEGTDEDGDTYRRLRTVDERCIFLRDDLRCGIHAAYGAAAKPAVCQLYPLESLTTIAGIRVYDRGACSTFAVSSRSGPPLLHDLEQLRSLLREQPLYHPVVLLPAPDADLPIDYGWFLLLLEGQLELIRRRLGGAPETLRAAMLVLLAATQRVNACPIEANEPARSLVTVLSQPMSNWFPPPASEARMREGAGAVAMIANDLLDGLHEALAGALRAGRGWLSARMSREAYHVLDLLRAAAAQANDARTALPPHHVPAVATRFAPEAEAEVDEVLQMSLLQQLFGYRALIESRPTPALLRLAMIQLMAVFGARLTAANHGRPAVAADLSWGHMLAVRLFDMPGATGALVQHEDVTRHVIDALPMLLGLWPRAPAAPLIGP